MTGGVALTFRLILLIGLAVALVILVGGALAVSRIDLASVASGYLSDKIGRKLTIGTAKLHFGNPVQIELGGVSLANMPVSYNRKFYLVVSFVHLFLLD